MAAFTIAYSWEERPDPLFVDEDELGGGPSLWAALRRFISRYRGIFKVPLADQSLEFWFDYDLEQAWDQFPDWLGKLANASEVAARLEIPSTGTMAALIARRDGGRITLRAQSLLSDSPFLSSLRPITVPAPVFLGEWARFLLAILDALVEGEPRLRDDAEWLRYHAALVEVMRS